MKKFIVAVVVLVLIALGVYYFTKAPATVEQTPVTTTGDTSGNTGVVATMPENKYKNGTYTATGTYGSPAGTEHIQVSVTLKNDIITAATVTDNEPRSPASKFNQDNFISG